MSLSMSSSMSSSMTGRMEGNFRQLLLNGTRVIDVRAPIEFLAGSIPNSVNLPILNDFEREEIGKLYKAAGQEAALQRGHELVSGPIKSQRITNWLKALETKPGSVITCFRGGKRSQIAQTWLKERGYEIPRIDGGYKAFRQFLLAELERLSVQRMLVVSGATGSGKTLLIREAQSFWPTVDLEAIGNHRGSAFGGYPSGQPTQIDFENHLALNLIRKDHQKTEAPDERPLLVEDESRLVGRCAQPPAFFETLRNSEIIYLEENLASRVKTTFDDYILNSPIGKGLNPAGLQTFDSYQKSLKAISKKLGGARFSEVEADLMKSQQDYENGKSLESNSVWIEKLLRDYYDPLYFHSLERRQPAIIFRGSRQEVLQALREGAIKSPLKAL